MSGRSRIYELEYKETNKPVYVDEAGSLYFISGILMQGMGANFLLIAPNGISVDKDNLEIITPTLEEWCEILKRTDDPLIFEQDKTGTIIAIHHKQERVISGAVQQVIWHRDGWQCLLCGKSVPDVQLTIDHFVPLELGGANEPSNYISACRSCQKLKGCRDPQEYCRSKGLDYDGLVAYLAGKASKLFVSHLQK